MFMLDNKPISIDAPYETAEGVRYPNLKDFFVRAHLGIVEVPEPEGWDQRFYWGVGNPKLLDDRPEFKEDGTPLYVQVYDPATESMVDTTEQVVTKGLKSQWIAQVKDTAGKMLAQTDWMELRKLTRQIEIPAAIVTTRAAILAECERLETAIMSCTSVEELISIVNNQGWPRGD